jgi:IS5 family transposase
MRVTTNQSQGFADALVVIPESEFDNIKLIIDWKEIAVLLQEINSDYNPVSMFKALLLATWHNLSDDRLSKSLERDLVFMRFCGFSLSGRKPDESTICRFRNKLVKQGIYAILLSKINIMLGAKDLKVNNGKHVTMDATLIKSARRPRKVIKATKEKDGNYKVEKSNEEEQIIEYSDDKEATYVKKGKKVVYGYASYVVCDDQGMVDSVSTLSAHESEMSNFADNIKKANITKGSRVLYDKGAASKNNSKALKDMGLRDGIMKKKPRGKEFSKWDKLRNKAISKRRFVVERTFGTMKRVYGLSRARYIGIEKVEAETILKAIAYNIKRAVNIYNTPCLAQGLVCLK